VRVGKLHLGLAGVELEIVALDDYVEHAVDSERGVGLIGLEIIAETPWRLPERAAWFERQLARTRKS
jgi:hypothetical protein